LIQLIDFLAIRRRPARDKFFARFLAVGDRHRAALGELTGDAGAATAPDEELRARLAALPDRDLPRVLSSRELEDLERGYRERVAGRGILGCRYLGDDVIEGGSHLDDATWFGVELARAGLDFLSISKGGKFEDAKQPKVGWSAYPYTGRSGYECMPTIYSDAA